MIPAPVAGTAAVAAAAITAAFMLLHQPASPASVGAGAQLGPVYVTAGAGTDQRARVNVQDTGSSGETLTVVGGWEHGSYILPLSWVRGPSIAAAPGVWRTVTFTVAVPAGTAKGQYWLLVGVSAAPPGNPGGAGFGTKSFTNLVVTVVPSTPPRHATMRNDRTQPRRAAR